MTQQDTQPPAETLAEAREAAALAFDARARKASHPEVVALDRHHAKVIRAGEGDEYDAVQAALIALTRRAGGDAIPAGWQLMPVALTDAMREAATGVPISSMIGTPGMVRIDYDEADAIWSAMQSATPKPPAGGDAIPAGEGEPVAWRWERRGRFGPEIGAWEQVFTPYPPDKWPEDDRRNIVPLYATPKPPAGGDAGAVRQALSQAVGALQPFADADEGDAEDADHMAVWPTFTVGDLRRAVDAVKEGTAALALPAPVVEGDLAWLGSDTRLSLEHYSPVYGDDDDQSREWRVHRESGSINDRIWDIVGRGSTPHEAIAAARAALSEGRSHG